jgi:hypothetical protein
MDFSAFVIGCPPKYRGGLTKGNDLEINLLKMFPNSAFFIEKVRAPSHMRGTC